MTLALAINGRAYGPMDVRDDLTMNDFLREHLGMTGTKFGCGAGQCLSCSVIADRPDGTNYTNPTCIVPVTNFNGKKVRTIEGTPRTGNSPSCKGLYRTFAFQCGYCTPGFLNEGQVCSSVWRERQGPAKTLRQPLAKRSMDTFAIVLAMSSITRRYELWFLPTQVAF
jgi:aerobic-type carbon monoxide dehydrogenase small subunit (CoxS/CutS family)